MEHTGTVLTNYIICDEEEVGYVSHGKSSNGVLAVIGRHKVQGCPRAVSMDLV